MWVGLITAGHYRTTAGKLQHNNEFYAIDRPKSNNVEHKGINVFTNNANGYSG